MVKIRVDMETLEVQVDGHANSADFGRDLVCCALSMLTETLARYFEKQMSEGNLANLTVEIQEGHAYINPTPYGWSLQDAVTAIRVIREGYRALAAEHGKYIRLEED